MFYADENNIYLIADDYIKYENCPKSKNNRALKQGDTVYKIYSKTKQEDYENTILEDYTGSADIASELHNLNSSYFSQNFTSVNDNMKVVAYMMDTNAWSTYKDENGKADYAIGGPTVEMLMKSYSKKYNVHYRAKAASNIGYEVSKDGGTNWNTSYPEMLSTTDSLYVINSYNKAKGMWIGSTSNYNESIVMSARWDGQMSTGAYYDDGLGFRPLVCLNSNVQLEANETGTGYIIK